MASVKPPDSRGDAAGAATLPDTATAHELARRFGLAFREEIDPREIDPSLLAALPIQYARRAACLPLHEEAGGVLVALADPRATHVVDDLRALFGRSISPVVAPASAILDGINAAYDRAQGTAEAVMGDIETAELDAVAHELEEPRDLLDADDEAPIIRLVNSLLFQAVKDRASDIHIEPFERDVSVRFRIDGMLYDVLKPPRRFHPTIVARVKIMSGLDIAERRLPQDGRLRFRVAGRDIDVRVSIVPTQFGERAVLRLLDRTGSLLSLEDLGLLGEQLAIVQRLIQRSHGILLVTGPTGSGKTTTLYAALSRLNSTLRNIITIEDPIEYQLHGVGQIQVNPKIDLTFANGLRSILRQDPDVIMVGEIRDSETAEIAIQAALTGHLVFSTLHTNDSFGALSRLVDMGIEPFLVSSSLVGVMAQRLVRRVCVACREPVAATAGEERELGIRAGTSIFRAGEGCGECKGTGYRGRTGIHEILVVDDEVRSLVMQRADASAVRRLATGRGMATLRDDGAAKVRASVTTAEEVLRVTQDDVL
ncbi:MAG TPA: type II secretion system ATPase GspE [Candidatus Binatia bacterium]|nr:type II secretion system ATPase GspE [Candidatus Binatia bacterium]